MTRLGDHRLAPFAGHKVAQLWRSVTGHDEGHSNVHAMRIVRGNSRIRQGYNKAHWIDAACVGEAWESVFMICNNVLEVYVASHNSFF